MVAEPNPPTPAAAASGVAGPGGSGPSLAGTVLRVIAIITMACVAVQFAFAGLGVFQRQNHHVVGGYFGPHIALGNIIGVITLVLLVVALLTRQPASYLITAGILFVLAGPVQQVLPKYGGNADGWFGALHALVGFVIGGLVGVLLAQGRRLATSSRA